MCTIMVNRLEFSVYNRQVYIRVSRGKDKDNLLRYYNNNMDLISPFEELREKIAIWSVAQPPQST
jgi:hypothetical protein